MLDTWESALIHHPRVHMIVRGGGIALDGSRWISSRPAFLLPVKVLGKLFRRFPNPPDGAPGGGAAHSTASAPLPIQIAARRTRCKWEAIPAIVTNIALVLMIFACLATPQAAVVQRSPDAIGIGHGALQTPHISE